MPEIRSPLFSHFPSFSLSFFLSVFGLNVISLCSTLSSHLSCAIIFFLSLSCDQSDQMARLFFHYLAKYNNDILPDSVSFQHKFAQNGSKYHLSEQSKMPKMLKNENQWRSFDKSGHTAIAILFFFLSLSHYTLYFIYTHNLKG